MYIETVPNRNSPPAILLREGYREDGKVKKRTLANLSHWDPQLIEHGATPQIFQTPKNQLTERYLTGSFG